MRLTAAIVCAMSIPALAQRPQTAVTAGAMPTTLPTKVAAAWTTTTGSVPFALFDSAP